MAACYTLLGLALVGSLCAASSPSAIPSQSHSLPLPLRREMPLLRPQKRWQTHLPRGSEEARDASSTASEEAADTSSTGSDKGASSTASDKGASSTASDRLDKGAVYRWASEASSTNRWGVTYNRRIKDKPPTLRLLAQGC